MVGEPPQETSWLNNAHKGSHRHPCLPNRTAPLEIRGGPNTPEGKEVARWNAARHGIRSPSPVVPGLEKPEDWQEYRDGMLGDLAPAGPLELALAERMALLSWRLHRVKPATRRRS